MKCPLCSDEIMLPTPLPPINKDMPEFVKQASEISSENYAMRCQTCGAWIGEVKTCSMCGTANFNTWDSHVHTQQECGKCGEALGEIECTLPALTVKAYHKGPDLFAQGPGYQ